MQADKLNAQTVQFVERIYELLHGAREAIEAVHDHNIDFATPRVSPQRIELWSAFLRTRNAAVQIPVNLPAAGLTEAYELQ